MRDAMLALLDRRPPPVAQSWLTQFTTRHSAERYLEILLPASA